MSSYPPGGDYDERLLSNAPKATKAELQEGYNVNLLASDSSDAPINARQQPTVDGHTTLEAAPPPSKEGYTSYSVPWYRQGKWRIFVLIAAIVVIGAVVGGVVGGTAGKKNKNGTVTPPGMGSSGPSTVSVTSTPGAGASPVTPAQSNQNNPISSPTPSPGGTGASPEATVHPNNGTRAANIAD